MKLTLRLAATLLPLFVAGYAAADDAAPVLPTIAVQAVTTADPTGYAMWIAKANAAFKAAGGPDHFVRVYQALIAGEDTGTVYAVTVADSAVNLAKATAARDKVPERADLQGHLGMIRKLGPLTLVKAVYAEGGYDGESLYITNVNLTDQAAYLKALGDFRALLDSHDLKDAKLNLFRVIAGRSNHTHEVVISSPNKERTAALLDATSTPWMAEWLASVAPIRTVVSNGTYQEISQ